MGAVHPAHYAQLAHRVGQAVRALQRMGIGPDDIVSSQLPNVIEASIACLAADRRRRLHNPVQVSGRTRGRT